MATVVVTWTTKQQAFPAGTVGGVSEAQIFQPDGVTNVSTPMTIPSGTSASFGGINPGNYLARVKRYANDGAVLGTSQAGFTVAAPAQPPVNVDVPDVVNVSVS